MSRRFYSSKVYILALYFISNRTLFITNIPMVLNTRYLDAHLEDLGSNATVYLLL